MLFQIMALSAVKVKVHHRHIMDIKDSKLFHCGGRGAKTVSTGTEEIEKGNNYTIFMSELLRITDWKQYLPQVHYFTLLLHVILVDQKLHQ